MIGWECVGKRCTQHLCANLARTYRRHERVEYADCKGSAASKRLREVELRVGIVVVVLVQKLHVAIIHQFCIGPVLSVRCNKLETKCNSMLSASYP